MPDHCGTATASTSINDEGGCVIGGEPATVNGADPTEVGDTTADALVLDDNDSCEAAALRCAADGGAGLHALSTKPRTSPGASPHQKNRRRGKTEALARPPASMP